MHELSRAGVVRLGGDLPRLTSLRAFAAFAVFLYHLARHSEWAVGDGAVRHGYVGVGFFFILSGFVLTWATKPETGIMDFYSRRVARVYPSHLVVLLIAAVLPVLALPKSWEAFVASLTLTQAWFPQWPISFGMNAVAWSLSCEFFFYACTPFLLRFLGERPTVVVVRALGGWFLAMSAVAVMMGLSGNALDIYAYTLPIVRSGEFAVGMLLGFLARRGQLPGVPVWVGVALVGLAWSLTLGRALPQSVANVVFAPAFTALVASAASADLRGLPGRLLTSRWLQYVGQVSFAFYLVHELVLLNGRLIWGAGPGTLPARLALMTVVVVATFGVSAALHEGVEKPAQRAIRGWTRRYL